MVTLAPYNPVTGSIAVRRIEILGVFGAGKTTLARRLAGEGVPMLAERHSLNPFWGNEHSQRSLGSLPYDLSFLIQHAHMAATAPRTRPYETVICDWSFATDRLWALMRLGGDFRAYEAVFRIVLDRLGPPAGYFYLRQPVHIIVERLGRRGRSPEKALISHVRTAVARLDRLARSLPEQQVMEVGDDARSDQLVSWLARPQEVEAHE